MVYSVNCFLFHLSVRYVDVENVKHNEAHQSVQEEMKKFNKLPDDSMLSEDASEPDRSSQSNKSNQSTKSGKGKARKELPLMSFVEGRVLYYCAVLKVEYCTIVQSVIKAQVEMGKGLVARRLN